MKNDELLNRYQRVLSSLSYIPRNIIQQHHQLNNIPEFVLHDLCSEHCFNLNKAAYFVDNPDFNYMKGIAGFNQAEKYSEKNVWQNPNEFTRFMQNSQFNSKVKNYCGCSAKKNSSVDHTVKHIADEIGINNPAYCYWDMKHDNHGLLVYEKQDKSEDLDEHFLNSLYLLSFCPIH